MTTNESTRARIAEIVASMDRQKAPFLGAVKSRLKTHLERTSSRTCLTIIERYSSGREQSHAPAVSGTYFGVLWDFCWKKPHNGNALDSAVTAPTIEIVVQEYQKLFTDSSSEFASVFSAAVMQDDKFRSALVDAISKTWGGTLPAAVRSQALSAVSNALASRTQDVMHSSVVQTTAHAVQAAAAKGVAAAVSSPVAAKVAAILVHNLSVALASHIKVVIAKLIASGALKTVLVGKLKAVLAGTVLAAVIHALAAKLAALGISAGPGAVFFVVVAPLLAIYIRYQYTHLPEKLASTVPDNVIAELDGRYREVNLTIVDNIYQQVISAGVGLLLSEVVRDSGFSSALNELVKESSDS